MIDSLSDLIAPLNQVVFSIGSDSVSWAELLGFITGGLCVWLTVKRNVANFPVGILNSFFFLVLFLSARLWADGVLQILYITLGFIGWWYWLYGGRARNDLPVTRVSRNELVACTTFVAAATVVLYFVLKGTHGSAPFWDACTTALALSAQWLLNRKKVESWYFWIAADCIYIPLYFAKDLNLTGVVYILFLCLCLRGLKSWQQSVDDATVPAPAAAA